MFYQKEIFMSEELKGYNRISKSEMQGYLVHIYEWDSPSGMITPKHAVAVQLKQKQEINVAIKTFTEDWQSSLSLMDDRIFTGDNEFDSKIIAFGIGGERILPVFTNEIKRMMLDDDHLSMDINPEVVVIRRYGEAEVNEKLQDDINLSISTARIVDEIAEGKIFP
jgi:hypothetical protein